MFEKIRLRVLQMAIARLKSDIAFEEDQIEIVGESSSDIEKMKNRLARLEKKRDEFFLKTQLKAPEEEIS